MKTNRVELEWSIEHNRFRIKCEKHGYVELSDEAQEAFAGIQTHNFISCPATCPTCVEEFLQREKERKRMTHMNTARRKARIPRRFCNASLDNWVAEDDKQRLVASVCEVYADMFQTIVDEGSGMIFAGPPGTGKTHMACAIINAVIELGFTGMYTSGLAMKQAVQETYSDKEAGTRQSAIASFIHPNLLVIDEIDLMHASEDAQLIIWEVISGRYNEVKPTIIISNLTKQELSEQLGERIIDRLRENSGRFVAFNWDSHRRNRK